MAQQTIGLGTTDNDGTGDGAKAAGTKINANFTELYGITDALGTAANEDVEYFATAAQGTLADNAIPSSDAGNFATAAQGDLADTALQRRASVIEATGWLNVATHSGQFITTTGSITIPHASGSEGFNCVLRMGAAHTITFNGATSSAMASGDLVSVFVEADAATGDPPIIRLRRSPASEQVTLT